MLAFGPLFLMNCSIDRVVKSTVTIITLKYSPMQDGSSQDYNFMWCHCKSKCKAIQSLLCLHIAILSFW